MSTLSPSRPPSTFRGVVTAGVRSGSLCLVLVAWCLLILASAADAAADRTPPNTVVKPETPARPIHPFLLRGGEVHGTIYALGGGEVLAATAVRTTTQIFLPDISVYLKNATTSAAGPAVTTSLDGTFAFPAQAQGKYVLCWKAAGFAAGCAKTPFQLGSTTLYLKPTAIAATAGVVYGRVTLKDGVACRYVLPAFGRNTFTQVTAKPASGPARTVRANSSGFYLVPALPGGAVSLAAKCEGASTAASSSVSGGATLVNLTLPNVRPAVDLAYASQGGKMVRAAATGSTVQVTAKVTDGGGYPLHYSWLVDPATPGFISQDSPSIDWKIPAGAGLATIYVLAHDDHGGNAFRRIPLSTAPDHIAFSGHVLGSDTPSLAEASVSINGVTAQSNAGGNFELSLPGEAPRYVVTITKPGYQMLSRALYAPATGATFKLYRAQQFQGDPTAPIALTETPRKDPATGGNDRAAGGAQLEIPANALGLGADGTGGPATHVLRVQMASYDLRDAEDQVPGDYGGIDKSGKGAALQSFGALDVAIYDQAGNPVNLAPGSVATVRTPIDPALMADAPATIPVWHYDTAAGLWREDGVATKVGGFYETKVTHFSAVNMDLAFGTAACTIINVDTSIMPVPFRLQMTALTGPAQVLANHQNQVIGDAVNVVVREPPGIQVRFDVVDSNGNILTNASQTITVGAATPDGADWMPPPSPPYDCSTTVSFDETHPVQAIFPAGPNGFLTYQTPTAYLTPATADPLSVAYYHAIDPAGTKTAGIAKNTPGKTSDFANWQTANGFSRPGPVRVAYQNLYDLGFGRDMHMQSGGATGTCAACIAFYVTNYPDADAAANADPATVIATVAMEYGPLDGTGATFTRFYVFGANEAISDAAVLDGFGAKNVPALCVICHNGNIASNATTTALAASGGNLQDARFIPFDTDSLAMPSAAAFSLTNQANNFNAMNTAILQQTNPSPAEVKLITAWYGHEGNTAAANTTFNGGAVPSDWSAASTLYTDVVKTSCRLCHATRDPGDPGAFQDLSWSSYSGFNGDAPTIQFIACSATTAPHPMPQAERTFARFWLSTEPNAPITLGNAGLTGWGAPVCP